MDYANFDHIDLPNLTVTEPNPAHVLDFRRFASDEVVSFNKLQADIIRAYSDAPIAHNYMGRITDFDHFKVGDDLDIASWDSYPLGFLEDRVSASEAHRALYARQGDPDFQAFHHDLYRAVGKGRWWIMEQQPGPVNWAPYNPAPLPGMVRLWTWRRLPTGPRPCAISAGAKPQWPKSKCTPVCCAPIARRPPPIMRRSRWCKSCAMPPTLRPSNPKWP
jgi:beta-galactosidase